MQTTDFLPIFIIFTDLKIEENTRKISLPGGLEPTSPSFRGRCLNNLDIARCLLLHFRLSYSMLQCCNLREKSTKTKIIKRPTH